MRKSCKILLVNCDEPYSLDQMVQAERYMLRDLDYRIGWPGPLPFLERISKASEQPRLTNQMAEYILEANCGNSAFVSNLPSLMAAIAFFLAQSLQGNSNWVSISTFPNDPRLTLDRHLSKKNL